MKKISFLYVTVMLTWLRSILFVNGKKDTHYFIGSSSHSSPKAKALEYLQKKKQYTQNRVSKKSPKAEQILSSTKFSINPDIELQREKLEGESDRLSQEFNRNVNRDIYQALNVPRGIPNRNQLLDKLKLKDDKKDTSKNQKLISMYLNKSNKEVSDILYDQSIKNKKLSKDLKYSLQDEVKNSKIEQGLRGKHEEEEALRVDSEYSKQRNAGKLVGKFYKQNKEYFKEKVDHRKNKGKKGTNFQ